MTHESPTVLPDGFESADYEHWARVIFWSAGEATAMALGCEPVSRERDSRRLHSLMQFGSEADQEFVRRAAKMTRLVERHFGNSHFIVKIEPSKFLFWLRDQRLWIPDGMAEAIAEFDHPLIDWQARATAAETNSEKLAKRVSELEGVIADGAINSSSQTRERDSLLKLFIGMAVKGYAYDPKAARSSVASEISIDLQLLGLSLSDDTIRKYLRDGAEILPPSEAD